MQKFAVIILLVTSALLLMSCSSSYSPAMVAEFGDETWMGMVDHSFGYFYPNSSPYPYVSKVRVAPFTNVSVKGNIEVQIENGPSGVVSIAGSQKAVKHLFIGVSKNTLSLHSNDHLVVRLSTPLLQTLQHEGAGHIFLQGISVAKIINKGPGHLILRDITSANLEIISAGNGSTYVSGNFKVRAIEHHGCNNISLQGARSDGLTIHADGAGRISIMGDINLKEIRAASQVWVLIPCVRSQMSHVFVNDRAVVGLAGMTHTLYVQTGQSAQFLGRELCVVSAYARAWHNSHMNMTAAQRAFIAAYDNASIYFYGSPIILTKFEAGSGMVLPMRGYDRTFCVARIYHPDKGAYVVYTVPNTPTRRVHVIPPRPSPTPAMGHKSRFAGEG